YSSHAKRFPWPKSAVTINLVVSRVLRCKCPAYRHGESVGQSIPHSPGTPYGLHTHRPRARGGQATRGGPVSGVCGPFEDELPRESPPSRNAPPPQTR